MTIIQQAEQLLIQMTYAEKLQFLQIIAHDLGAVTRGIVSTPGVCGGEPRIAGTRIPVWALVQYRNLGVAEAELLRIYPTLRSEDLVNAWTYYESHPQAIAHQILENETA